MKVYFGVLKDGAKLDRVVQKLVESEINILRFYPKLSIIKFESDKTATEINFDFFITVEEEKENFSI